MCESIFTYSCTHIQTHTHRDKEKANMAKMLKTSKSAKGFFTVSINLKLLQNKKLNVSSKNTNILQIRIKSIFHNSRKGIFEEIID